MVVTNANNPANSTVHTSRRRNTVGIVLLLIVVLLVAAFLAYRLGAIGHLYQIGIRRDAILLLTVRDVSLAVLALSGGYVLSSLVCKWRTTGRVVAVLCLAFSSVTFGFGAYLEQRLRSRVQDNLEQFRRAVENYKLNQKPGDSSGP